MEHQKDKLKSTPLYNFYKSASSRSHRRYHKQRQVSVTPSESCEIGCVLSLDDASDVSSLSGKISVVTKKENKTKLTEIVKRTGRSVPMEFLDNFVTDYSNKAEDYNKSSQKNRKKQLCNSLGKLNKLGNAKAHEVSQKLSDSASVFSLSSLGSVTSGSVKSSRSHLLRKGEKKTGRRKPSKSGDQARNIFANRQSYNANISQGTISTYTGSECSRDSRKGHEFENTVLKGGTFKMDNGWIEPSASYSKDERRMLEDMVPVDDYIKRVTGKQPCAKRFVKKKIDKTQIEFAEGLDNGAFSLWKR